MSQSSQQSSVTGSPADEDHNSVSNPLPGGDGANNSNADSEDDAGLSKDDLFHLLQNERRRAVLRYLRGREDEAVRMRDVAEQVAAWEHDTTLQALTSDERQRVYIALYQSHLDKLADAGVIEYNKPRGVVRTTEVFPDVVTYVDVVDNPDDGDESTGQWEHRYLGVSVVSSLLLLGSVLDVTVLQVLSGFLVSVVILAMFSGLTLLRMLESQSDPVDGS